MGDTSETNTNVLSLELFFRCGSTKNAYTENHYMRDMGPFPRYGHIMLAIIMGILICYVFITFC